VDVVDADLAAVAAVGRHDVGGAARQEDASDLEALGDVGHRLSSHDVLDLDRDLVGPGAACTSSMQRCSSRSQTW
jgi:hypothetical protein